MLLGDLGADVVKVERPWTGDDTRAWGPPWRGDESTYYLGLNRNKRSVVLDLADEGDRALARTLGERADVLLESFRPGLMASWGLDGDTIRAVNPRLVSCSVTAFGSGERAKGMPGYDFLLQAMGGSPAASSPSVAATATRASSRTRPTRRPTARSRSPSATIACSRACARRSG